MFVLRKNMKKRLLTISVILGLSCVSFLSFAETSEKNEDIVKIVNIDESAKEFAKSKVSDVLQTFKKEPKNKYADIIQKEIYPHLEWKIIGNRVLGKYNRQFSAEQRQNFDQIFQKMLTTAYVGIVDSYKDSEVKIIKTITTNDITVVKMKLYNQSSVGMDLVLKKQDNTFKILDVIVDHISFMEVYRTGFSQELQQKNVEEFLKTLEAKIKK